ncbi:MAG TPA: hypothetical protein VHW90_02255 [Stellaceae bacterium]|jgi:tetratricopeptide (TPR) repeat protein|nr:hypothetical protein [Stellaceae bacterium]
MLSRIRAFRRFMLLTFVLLGLLGGSTVAQELSATDKALLQARQDALFQQTLRDPANLDTAFAYADVSAKLGDNEAAVSALERMLLFNPNLPRVQLELGALYFRMGSYEIARTYFDKALTANPPPEVKERVETYLGQIDRLNAPQSFTGFVFMGAQYQSDANVAPGSPLISSPVGSVLLDSQFVKGHDQNVFGTGSFLYSYDLGTQDRDTLEVSGTGFGNRYSRFSRLDLGLAEITAGPRFNYTKPLPYTNSASLKPYFITNDVSLGSNQYFHTLGVGAEASATVLDDVHIKSYFEFRQKNFEDAPDRPLSRGLNGSDKLFSLFISKPVVLVPQSELSLDFDFLDQDTRLAFYSNKSYAGALAYRIRYDDPTRLLHFPWESTVFVSRSWADYAGPDPCCNTSPTPGFFSGSDRLDRRWRFGITQSFQVANNISLIVQLQRDVVSSNLSLYGYSSDSILIGPQIRF